MRILCGYRVYTYRSRRGMVLITAMWIIIALTAIVLVLCREMVVESMVTRQHLAQARADAAEIGVEQFALSIVEQELYQPGYKDSTSWEARPIGECYFWVITYDYDNPSENTFKFGLTDEASKVDLNTWPVESLEYLPGMSNLDYNIAAEIVDWRDADDLVTLSDLGGTGAENNDYQSTLGYYAKNAPFESVEELRLLKDVDETLLYGDDKNHNGVLDPEEEASSSAASAFDITRMGLMPFVTVYGEKATNIQDTTSTSTFVSPIADLNLTDTQGNAITQPIDVNLAASYAQNGPLQQMLTQVLGQQKANAIRTQTANGPSGQPRQANAAANSSNTFTSVIQWAIRMETQNAMTAQDLQQVFQYVAANPPANPNNSTDSIYTHVGKLNLNTASKPALMCLPGFEEADADAIITQRQTMTTTTDANGVPQVGDISWVMDAGIDQAKLIQAGKYMTGSSTIFSADIVTVSQDGRGFKRVKIVVDGSSGTPQIIYRRDLTDWGWPLDPQIRENLLKGIPPTATTSVDGSTPGGRLSMGVR